MQRQFNELRERIAAECANHEISIGRLNIAGAELDVAEANASVRMARVQRFVRNLRG